MAEKAVDLNEGVALGGLIGPSQRQFSPTFSDSEELEFVARKFIVNVQGTIHYEDKEGNEHTYEFPVGTYDIMIRKIYTSGTTISESDILCLI